MNRPTAQARVARSTTDASRRRTSAATGASSSLSDDREHALGVDRGHVRRAVTSVDDDVAGQQRAEIGLRLERPVGERWVAGAEDQVGLAVDAELLLQRGLDVDLAEDSESLRLELLAYAFGRFGEPELGGGAQRVAGCKHSHSSSR